MSAATANCVITSFPYKGEFPLKGKFYRPCRRNFPVHGWQGKVYLSYFPYRYVHLRIWHMECYLTWP